MSGTRRFVTGVLAIVAAVLVLAVVVKYWPPAVERGVLDAIAWLGDRLSDTWRRIGGRWVTIAIVALGILLGLAVLRRQRSAGLLLIEVSIVGGAIAALLQPAGW